MRARRYSALTISTRCCCPALSCSTAWPGAGLVEHEDARAAVQRLDDLDALLLPDAQLLDALARGDAEADLPRERADAALGLGLVEEDGSPHHLRAQHDVLGDGEDRHEHEVLVHHPDPARDG